MIQKLFIVLLLLLLLPDLYIYIMYILRCHLPIGIKSVYFLPSLLLLAGLVRITFFPSPDLMEKPAMGWFVITYFVFVLPKLLFSLCSLVDLPLKALFKWDIPFFSYLGTGIGLVCAVGLLYGAFVGKSRFDVREVTFRSTDLPDAFDGYKIVQLSDIHIGSWAGNDAQLQKAVGLVNAQQPDLIAFTGDLVNHRAIELTGFEKTLSRLKAKDGVYSVLGNHDYGPYHIWKNPREKEENLRDLERRETELGWKLLNNEHAYLRRENDSILLIGVENQGAPPFDGRGDLKKAMKGADASFKILLSHNPTHWRTEVIPQSDIDLTLSGHTHAMQLAFGHHSPSSLMYKEWSGMYREGKQHLYVNVGLGFVGMPFRLGAWPEITVITLKKGQQPDGTGS